MTSDERRRPGFTPSPRNGGRPDQGLTRALEHTSVSTVEVLGIRVEDAYACFESEHAHDAPATLATRRNPRESMFTVVPYVPAAPVQAGQLEQKPHARVIRWARPQALVVMTALVATALVAGLPARKDAVPAPARPAAPDVAPIAAPVDASPAFVRPRRPSSTPAAAPTPRLPEVRPATVRIREVAPVVTVVSSTAVAPSPAVSDGDVGSGSVSESGGPETWPAAPAPAAPIPEDLSAPVPPRAPTDELAAAASIPNVRSPQVAIRGVLDQYREAFNDLDPVAAQHVWPSVDVKALGRAFGGMQAQEFSMRSCAIDVRGSRAVASCEGTLRYVPKVGSRAARVEKREWQFNLSANDDHWLIDAVVAR